MTRCNILIKNMNTDTSVWVYKHCDGYPSVTGDELKRFLSTGNNSSLDVYDMLDGLIYMYGDIYEEANYVSGDSEYIYFIYIEMDVTKLSCTKMNHEWKDNKNNPVEVFSVEYPHKQDIDNIYSVKQLKNCSAKLEYLDKINLTELGVLDNISDDTTISEYVLSEKIIEKIKSRIENDLAIELVDKKY